MADEKYQIELEVHAGSAAQEIQRIDHEIDKVGASALDVKTKVDRIFKLKRQRAEAAFNLKQLQKEFQNTGKAASQAGGLKGVGFFGQQIGFLISDSKYGLLGMGNNLSFLATQFVQLQGAAKATGASLGKELLKSLRGPTGILIAIQVLIAWGPEIVAFFNKWLFGVKETAKAIKELSKEQEELTKKIDEEYEAIKEQRKERRGFLYDLQDELKWRTNYLKVLYKH